MSKTNKTKTAALFPDTNIFYDYSSIDHIKWLSFVSAEQVVIVIPPVVFRELNAHKDGGHKPHLASRASSILHNLTRFFDLDINSNVISLSPQVDLLGEYRDAPVDPPLNFLVPDDQLIANILLYRTENPDQNVYLVTGDVGLQLKARGVGLPCLSIPDKYLAPTPLDPRDKKLKVLEELVAKLQDNQPRLCVEFENDNESLTLTSNDWHATYTSSRSIFDQQLSFPPRTAPIIFKVCNEGSSQAVDVTAIIDLPVGCSIFEKKDNYLIGLLPNVKRSWYEFAGTGDDKIQAQGDKLSHGFCHEIMPVYITFPQSGHFEFTWTIHAGNLSIPGCKSDLWYPSI